MDIFGDIVDEGQIVHNIQTYLGSTLSVNSLPNDKILDVTKLKAFADDDK